MPIDRLRPRRLDDRDRDRAGGRRAAQPPPRPKDNTALYTGLGVGGGILILALAFAMSSGSEPAKVDHSADKILKEEMEVAQKLAQQGKLADALHQMEGTLNNPTLKKSALYPKALAQAEQYRQQVAFEREAVEAIENFDKRLIAAKADKTAMKNADAFYRECETLISKYRMTAKAKILEGWRQDLERWRGTMAQDDWQKEFPYTRDRIKTLVDGEMFGPAVKEWRQFSERFSSPELKSKVESEVVMINKTAAAAAQKLVDSAGTGAKAKAMLEEAQDRFNGTDGQKIIVQRIKALN